MRVLRTISASMALTLVLGVVSIFLPDNSYQRWQLIRGTLYDNYRWAYERIHFDPRPIDVAIVGSSKSLFGLSANRIEQKLAELGDPMRVVNFSLPAAGRNINWVIADELIRTKQPKFILLAIYDQPFYWGHPAFKYLAKTGEILHPPAFFLHDYVSDLLYLPKRQFELFMAGLFPNLVGLRDHFDVSKYVSTKTDFTVGRTFMDNSWIDMNAIRTEKDLLAQPLERKFPTTFDKLLLRCCNEGDEHTYVRAIADEARAHGVKLLFVSLPSFRDSGEIFDRGFYSQFGDILDEADLSVNPKLFQSRGHLNHFGADMASDRVAVALALRLSMR